MLQNKKSLIITCLIVCAVVVAFNSNVAFAQKLNYGTVVGVNMSIVNPRNTDIDLMKEGLYAGLFVSYPINKKIGLHIEGAFAQKHQMFFSNNNYSSFDILIKRFSFLYPEMLNIKELIESNINIPMNFINDTVFEMLDGVTRFNTIDVPITLTYDYKNFVFEAGAYISYLLGAKTNTIKSQNIPILSIIPDSLLTFVPYAEVLINSTFPAHKKPLNESFISISRFQDFDYGLIIGAGYKFGKFSLRLTYRYGLLQGQSLFLDANHKVIQTRLTYNLPHLRKSKAKLNQTN